MLLQAGGIIIAEDTAVTEQSFCMKTRGKCSRTFWSLIPSCLSWLQKGLVQGWADESVDKLVPTVNE